MLNNLANSYGLAEAHAIKAYQGQLLWICQKFVDLQDDATWAVKGCELLGGTCGTRDTPPQALGLSYDTLH